MLKLNTIDSISSPRIQNKYKKAVFMLLFIPYIGPYIFFNWSNGGILSISMFVLWVAIVNQGKDHFIQHGSGNKQKRRYVFTTFLLVVVFAAISMTGHIPALLLSGAFLYYWSVFRIKVLFHKDSRDDF